MCDGRCPTPPKRLGEDDCRRRETLEKATHLAMQGTGRILDRGRVRRVVFLPRQHCLFEGFLWRGKAAEELLVHASEKHYTEDVEQAVGALGAVAFRAALHTVLNSAVSWVCKQEAPVVSVAQDRRALRVFQESVVHAELQALI